MKKNDWIFASGIALYSFLFYHEVPGLNFFLFSILMVSMLLIRNPVAYKSKAWIAAATGVLLTGFCMMWYGNVLSFIGNILSLLLLSGLSFDARTSVLVGLFHSFLSVVGSIGYMVLDAIYRSEKKNTQRLEEVVEGTPPAMPHLDKRRGKWGLILIPLICLILFFVLYRASNPVFAELTEDIFDFISLEWLVFTLGGMLVMYGFFYHKTIPKVHAYDIETPNELEANQKETLLDRLMSLINEYRSGLLLFAMLNVLLLSVNLIDTAYLWMGKELPEGLSHSDSVHQGVGALIFSVVAAIAVILFYFRGRLNFAKGNRVLAVLAIVWIVQNAYMILSTALRNDLYIDTHALTEKRIGVYVWLGLTAIGLGITLIKIVRKRSNWFLVRNTGWSFYGVLVASCFFNWSVLITDYNLAWTEETGKSLDTAYLLELSPSNMPRLAEWCATHQAHPEQGRIRYRLGQESSMLIYQWQETSWKSWSKDLERVYVKMKALHEENFFKTAQNLSQTNTSQR